MTSPTSQALTPTDEKLDALIDELVQAVGIAEWADPKCFFPCCESRRVNAAAARAALVEYVSATTLTEEELRTLYNSVEYPLYDKIRRRASMKENE